MLWPIFKDTLHPVWFMRQAGRYLPEYQKVRAHYPDFMDLCFSSEGIVEVTLQPLRRFNVDASIIFSDILVVPHLLGQTVTFSPKPHLLEPNYPKALDCFLTMKEKLAPIQNAIQQIIPQISQPLFGFSGAPWTLAHYMKIESSDTGWIELLTQSALTILKSHVEAGAQMIQIFDSWASILPCELRNIWIKAPLTTLTTTLHKDYPALPILYYGRGISDFYKELAHLPIGFSVDEHASLKDLIQELPQNTILQGNISPLKLKEGNFEDDLRDLINTVKGRPHIFNLGQGILPQTPLEHVHRFIECVRKS